PESQTAPSGTRHPGPFVRVRSLRGGRRESEPRRSASASDALEKADAIRLCLDQQTRVRRHRESARHETAPDAESLVVRIDQDVGDRAERVAVAQYAYSSNEATAVPRADVGCL